MGEETIIDAPETTINAPGATFRGDPFAVREGKTLIWKNMNMTLSAGKKEENDKRILTDVWGEVPVKQTTAIMGPSGAGKTSVLNILAGRASTHGKVRIDADVRLNNFSVNPKHVEVRKQIAFVAQDDSLVATATPREAIYFSARLRLPRTTTKEDLERLTDRVLDELGLTRCADTLIGGPLLKGISGGERKRTSVGVELVTKPTLVFLDEPTSGLDSFSAVQVCQVLKKVANAGASVLFTIHQPSSEIFDSFDHLILMKKGRVMFQGPVGEVPDVFARNGHPMPVNFNPADWIMEVTQSIDTEQLEDDGFFQDDPRGIMAPSKVEKNLRDSLGFTRHRDPNTGEEVNDIPVSMGVELQMLFRRELTHIVRNKQVLLTKIGLNTVFGILFGVVFMNVGASENTSANVQSHFGALSTCLLMQMFGIAEEALLNVPLERPIFLREYTTNHYSVVAYMASKLCVEIFVVFLMNIFFAIASYFLIDFLMSFWVYLAILIALSLPTTALAMVLATGITNDKVALEIAPILFVPQLLFCGVFVSPSLIPSWLEWAQYLCTVTYGLRLIVIEEFSLCEDPGKENCDEVIYGQVNANPDDRWVYWVVLAGMFVGLRTLAMIFMRQRATTSV